MVDDERSWQGTYRIWVEAVDKTYRELIEAAAALVPSLVGTALLLLLGWLIAVALRALILRLGTRIDRIFQATHERTGHGALPMRWPLSRVLAHSVYWLVILFFLTASAKVLGLPGIAEAFSLLLLYLPLVLVAGAVMLLFYFASGLVGDRIAESARMAGLSNADLLGRASRAAMIAIAAVIVIGQLGVNVALLVNIVTLLVATVLGAVALAFAIGAGPSVRNVIASHYVRRSYRVGQRVRIGEHEGEILEMTPVAVVLDTAQGRATVPARVFIEQASLLVEEPAPEGG